MHTEMQGYSRETLLRKYGDFMPVLDHGHVALVDVLGDDMSIVRAARMSYVPHADGWRACEDAEDRTPQQNVNLINYLLRNNHGSPFEMVSAVFKIRLPIYVARQLMRYRTAKINEYSQRYSPAIDKMHHTGIGGWRSQSKSNKQGSAGRIEGTAIDFLQRAVDNGFDCSRAGFDQLSLIARKTTNVQEFLALVEKWHQESSFSLYDCLVKGGVAKEQARKILPVAQYTDLVFKIDARNLMNLLKQRLDPHAQQEIREYASVLYTIFSDWLPLTCAAFDEFVHGAHTLSAVEVAYLRKVSGATMRMKDPTELEAFAAGRGLTVGKRAIKRFFDLFR